MNEVMERFREVARGCEGDVFSDADLSRPGRR